MPARTRTRPRRSGRRVAGRGSALVADVLRFRLVPAGDVADGGAGATPRVWSGGQSEPVGGAPRRSTMATIFLGPPSARRPGTRSLRCQRSRTCASPMGASCTSVSPTASGPGLRASGAPSHAPRSSTRLGAIWIARPSWRSSACRPRHKPSNPCSDARHDHRILFLRGLVPKEGSITRVLESALRDPPPALFHAFGDSAVLEVLTS